MSSRIADTEKVDRRTLEEIRRGLCKEIEASIEALQGKRAQLNAIEREMERSRQTSRT